MNTRLSQQAVVNLFRGADTDRSGQIDHRELQRALSNGVGTPFNENTVRLMMSMFDRDYSGTIELNEFVQLVDYVQQWRACFQRFDRDNSGTIDARELQTALRSFGYSLSSNFIHLMVNRFDRTHRGVVAFDDFIHMCVSLQQLTNAFRPYDIRGNGWAQMNFEQFLTAAFSVIV
ncbi:Programmed cell death protein 6 [Fasciola gigantica]|uniref:Programmed cell death protein 6 n=1 Tax=Fasciola gigantica TaxID=46835 RepID=A0A504Y9Q3_FASGI|nr:Programmed cell death protein 6 [Fasciola gigantica]